MKFQTIIKLLLFWLTLGGLYLLSLYMDAVRFKTGFKLDWPTIATTALVYAAWGGITAILYAFLKRPIIAGKVIPCLFIFCFGLILCVPLISLLDYAVVSVFAGQEWQGWQSIWSSIRYVYVFFNAILYVVVFIVCAGIIYQQHSRKMQLVASEAARTQAEIEYKMVDMRMQALQSQLSPHFLFNCLNAISALTRMAEKAQVIQAIARMGDLLRYAVSASEKTQTTLTDELEFINNYVSLQQLRLGEQFSFSIQCDDQILSNTCPPFILHTLVENAIAHGSATDTFSLVVNVHIMNRDDQLVFVVTNSHNKQSTQPTSKGLGLAIENLKSRLNLLYGNHFTVKSSQTNDTYSATIIIPAGDPREAD